MANESAQMQRTDAAQMTHKWSPDRCSHNDPYYVGGSFVHAPALVRASVHGWEWWFSPPLASTTATPPSTTPSWKRRSEEDRSVTTTLLNRTDYHPTYQEHGANEANHEGAQQSNGIGEKYCRCQQTHGQYEKANNYESDGHGVLQIIGLGVVECRREGAGSHATGFASLTGRALSMGYPARKQIQPRLCSINAIGACWRARRAAISNDPVPLQRGGTGRLVSAQVGA